MNPEEIDNIVTQYALSISHLVGTNQAFNENIFGKDSGLYPYIARNLYRQRVEYKGQIERLPDKKRPADEYLESPFSKRQS